jgi:transcription elongation factor GreB
VSKAFTKDEAADEPVVVPARAPLPAGVPNYVTPRGLALLREELMRRQTERALLDTQTDAAVRRQKLATLTAQLSELEARLVSAVVVDPATQPHDEVRFGAQVTVRPENAQERTYRLVGVDEADGAHGLVAFVAPLARALLGRRVGEVVTLRTPRGEEELEVVAISYPATG